MQIILEISSIWLAHEFIDQLGGGRIVTYDGCPVDECGQYERENFSSITVEIEVQPVGEEE